MLVVTLLLLVSVLGQDDKKGFFGRGKDKVTDAVKKAPVDAPCYKECKEFMGLCKKQNRGDTAGVQTCMAAVIESPQGKKEAACSACKMKPEGQDKGEKGGMMCGENCEAEFLKCKNNDITMEDMKKMPQEKVKEMMDGFYTCVAGINMENKMSKCSMCFKEKMPGKMDGFGKCPEGCAETFAKNGGCVLFAGEEGEAMDFLDEGMDKCMTDGCTHAARGMCGKMCMSEKFDKSCCDEDTCDAEMAYCCSMESPEDMARTNRMFEACGDMMESCGMEDGDMPEDEAAEEFWGCVLAAAKEAGEEGMRCQRAQEAMFQDKTCGGEQMACMKKGMKGEGLGKCIIEMAADRDDEKCGRMMFKDKPEMGEYCLKMWGACLGENKGKQGYDAASKCVFKKAQEAAGKGQKMCMEALMKGEKDSGDESKDSKDAYCEEVCTAPYMKCMSLMEQGKLDGDGKEVDGRPGDGENKGPVECDEDENKVMFKGKDGKMMAKCCPAANTLYDWTDMENPKAMKCCRTPITMENKCEDGGEKDGGEKDGGDKGPGDKGPVECDEDENFKVMMKGKDGKMMAKCCPAANTLWDWTDMENPKALQCCRTPITMENKCEDGGQGGKPGRGRRRIVVRRRIINDILNWVTGGGDDKTSGEGDDDKMGGEDKGVWGWMDKVMGGGSGMMEDEDVEKNKMGEKIDKDRWTQKGDGEGGDKKDWWNKSGGKDMGEGEGEGSGAMQKKKQMMMEMSEACADQMTTCGKEVKDCGDDKVDCSEQEEMAFGDCLKRESNKTRGDNPKCAKLVSMVMKMMMGDDKDMGEGKENMCPSACAKDFVDNGGCALFGDDSSDEDSDMKSESMASEEKDEEWKTFINDDTMEKNECTESCYNMIAGMCMKECKTAKMEGEIPEGCMEDKECSYYYCNKMGKENLCMNESMMCQEQFDPEMQEYEFVSCIAKTSMTRGNMGCLMDLTGNVGEKCPKEIMDCLKTVDMASDRFGLCVWEKASNAKPKPHEDCITALEDEDSDDKSDDDDKSESYSEDKEEMDPRLLRCIVRVSGGPQTECGKCVVADSRPDEDVCQNEKMSCMKKRLTGEDMKKCLMMTAKNYGNKECEAALMKPDQKTCPEGCVDAYKKAGICEKWDEAEEIMMGMDGAMVEKCMVEACERALATACYGECDKTCLMPWIENGGCAVFGDDSSESQSESSEKMNPMDFMDKEMDDGKCAKINPTSCEWDAAVMCKKSCMDMIREERDTCPPMKCCSDEPPACCADIKGLEDMAYCCNLMEDDDDDKMPEGCGNAMQQCMRRMRGMENMKESGDMTSSDEEKLGTCIFQVAAANENVKCIVNMMPEEDRDYFKACWKETAGCMNDDGEFDEACFGRAAMKNKECMEAIAKMSDSSSEEPSSEETPSPTMTAVEISVVVNQYKKMKDCQKGKKGKAVKDASSMMLDACSKKMDENKKVYFEQAKCSEQEDGSLVVTKFMDGECSMAMSKMTMKPNERKCMEKGKKNILGMSFKQVDQCLPEYLKSVDGLMRYCRESKDNCKMCGGKWNKKSETCDKLDSESMTCSQVKDGDFCSKLAVYGCKANKKGKCKGKFKGM